MKNEVYILFLISPRTYFTQNYNEVIVGIYATKELAKKRESKIILYGGCGGCEYTKIKKYNIKLK